MKEEVPAVGVLTTDLDPLEGAKGRLAALKGREGKEQSGSVRQGDAGR